jgi:hypothetical protein
MATARAPDTRSDGPDTPAAIAHRIRDCVTVLANALEVIRLGDGQDTATAHKMAARQLATLARLADALHDPAHETPTPGSYANAE